MKDPLDQIRVASPCPASWDRMEGDERTRHCTLCELNVYNFAEMTRDEIRELLMRSEGRVCARLYRRADGTMITRDCPTAVQRVRQRVSQWAGATMAALLSVATFTRCASNGSPLFRNSRSRVTFTTDQATSQTSSITGVVVVNQIGVVPGATITIRDQNKRELHAITDAEGRFAIGPLPEGLYRMEVTLEGFDSAVVKNFQVKPHEIALAHVVLRMKAVETITVGALAAPYGGDHTARTTFSKDELDRLPF